MKGPAQGGGGEIVPVDGGHIIRSIGRKDRHSKVYTAKGPRDRRVRLSAHTAIQFYDVQDRLGYDRPSKAVDWLIRKAQAAIESLNETTQPPQPPWHAPTPDSNPSSSDLALEQQNSCDYNFQHNNHNSRCGDSSFMGEADLMNTMKSFFPAASFGSFENVPCQGSASFPAEDLGLSLQTFQAGSHSNSDIPFHGSFQRIDGWNGGAGGIFPTFAQRELLQSNAAAAAAANPWNLRPLISANHNHDDGDHRHLQPRNDFGLGFRVPARIYGEDEAPENHR